MVRGAGKQPVRLKEDDILICGPRFIAGPVLLAGTDLSKKKKKEKRKKRASLQVRKLRIVHRWTNFRGKRGHPWLNVIH